MITKTYHFDDLIEDRCLIKQRSQTIQLFFKNRYPEIEFNFKVEDSKLIYGLTKLVNVKNNKIPKSSYYKLALNIDYAHSLNLIHGDIHPKNLIDISTGLVLIDWEPSLYQIKETPVKMVTKPFVDSEDLSCISKRTDWLCFHHLITRSAPTFYKTSAWSDIKERLNNNSHPCRYLVEKYFTI